MLICALVCVAEDGYRCTLGTRIEVAANRALTLILIEEHAGSRSFLHPCMLLTELFQ